MHYKISKPFLEKKIPVFIDKPLSLDQKELFFFSKYIKKGQLMSTSGLRYSKETKILKHEIKKLGKIKFITANIVNDWKKYGVHILKVLDEIGFLDVKKLKKLTDMNHIILSLKNTNIIINCLGKNSAIYNISVFGDKGKFSIDFNDNFTAFKNTLKNFFYGKVKKF